MKVDSGNYSVLPPTLNYFNAVPSNHAVYFPGIHQTDSLNDFAFQPAGVFNDLCVYMTPNGRIRPGFDVVFTINYSNVGTTSLAGTIVFLYDNTISYYSSDLTPFSVTSDSIVWNLDTLNPFETGRILLTMHINSNLSIGGTTTQTVRVEPVIGDAYPACNFRTCSEIVTGSHDPNEILVDKDTLETTQLNPATYLEYTINFQNTGNDTAFTVTILNPIDLGKLDLSTFELLSASHPTTANWKGWEQNMEFHFSDILLPDSNVNEASSHGFVQYRIKPKSNLQSARLLILRAEKLLQNLWTHRLLRQFANL